MGDLGNEFIIGIVSAAGGAVVLYGLQKIDTLRRVVTNSVKRIRDLVNHLRKFVLAKKNTRVQTQAHFISRRYNMSLATLELTLFRWFEKRAELLPFIQHVHKNHKHERVRDKAYELPP